MVAALLAGVMPALAAATYADPRGDVKAGTGPDLVSISVSSTKKAVSFRFRFAKAPPLGISEREKWVDMLLVAVDIPPRGLKRGPGDWTGVDFSLGVHGWGGKGGLVRTGSREPVWFPVSTAGRTLTFTVARRHLGNPAWFDFVAAAGRESEDESQSGGRPDYAPARGVFHYRLTG
jgi:hypothetical protein